MDHLAILAKKRHLLAKILSGEKTIESRWYQSRRAPYQSIVAGDTVYFKESGDPVIAKAIASHAMFFDELDDAKIRHILRTYGDKICMSESWAPSLAGKRYCALIVLKDVQKIEPFEVNKRGFGNMSAWISVPTIDSIRK